MTDHAETILIRPTFKAYGEYLAVSLVLLYYYGLGLLVFLGLWLVLRRRRYEISPVKITAWAGKSAQVLRIDRIRDIVVKQDTIQRWLKVGSVRVLPVDKTLPAIDIRGIPFPVELARLLRKYQKDAQGSTAVAKKAPKKTA